MSGKKVQYGNAIDRRNKGMIKWDTNGDSLTKKCIVLFISFHEKDAHTKAKTLNALGQEHQVVHDRYSF